MSGTSKMPILVIGKGQTPRCFKISTHFPFHSKDQNGHVVPSCIQNCRRESTGRCSNRPIALGCTEAFRAIDKDKDFILTLIDVMRLPNGH
ncbi:hypothetical protein MAR_025670 [Mya arenaria]|uniref:EF-hand domain-containing protein n=1 Tax=Mya arenaria TaxID=6604 RepID=A0ABY7ENS0_MYAAR|nr:hypothetical protein MAR_025670 [Mya arenaria]